MTRSWGYPNGKIPLSAGVVVRGELFQPDAAAGLVLLERAYANRFGAECPIVQGYRPLGEPGDPANASASTQFVAWNYYQQDTRNHPVAARPLLINGQWVGTSSHGAMLAADLGGRAGLFNTVEHEWVVANAPGFGWAWGGTPSEAWHIDYVGPITVTASSARTVTNITEQELEMGAYVISSPTVGISLFIDGIRVVGANTPDELNAVTGATRLSISDAMHTDLLTKSAQKQGLPLLCRATDNGEVFILTDKLRGLPTNATYAELQKVGAPVIPITRDDVNAWK